MSSQSKGSVVSQQSEEHKKEVLENRKYLTQLIEILLYLSRQRIPIRGHFEDKDSQNQGTNQVLKNLKNIFGKIKLENLIIDMKLFQEISKRLANY